MFTSISITGVPVLDQDQALDFYVNTLGLEVHTDEDLGFMRWLTVNVPGDRSREILLERPGPPSMDDESAERVADLVSKGAAGGWVGLTTDDAQRTYEELVSRGVDITDEPTRRSYGIDFGIRDPFGNRLRILEPAGEA